MDWDPEDYAKHSGAQLVWAQELIARLSLGGAEAVLDVGCGDGKITAALASAVPQGFVLGVDSSPAFVQYARAQYSPEHFPNLRFAQMDARRLRHDRPFDVIFSNATLHWVDDHPAFLAGCARLLKPHGRLLVSCGGRGNAAGIIAVLSELIQHAPWASYLADVVFPYHFYAPSDYVPWLARVGLQPDRLELVEKDMTHWGRDGLAGWIRTTWLPYTQRLLESLREPFVDALVAAYVAQSPLDEEHRSHVRMIRLEVEAHKGPEV
jgi:trans-aconitate 2-methyltransferase